MQGERRMNKEDNLFPEDIEIENDISESSFFEEITQHHLQVIKENEVVGHGITSLSDKVLEITFKIHV